MRLGTLQLSKEPTSTGTPCEGNSLVYPSTTGQSERKMLAESTTGRKSCLRARGVAQMVESFPSPGDHPQHSLTQYGGVHLEPQLGSSFGSDISRKLELSTYTHGQLRAMMTQSLGESRRTCLSCSLPRSRLSGQLAEVVSGM